ncbi:lipopolysaccharide assembly LapA domain-containing protein [Halobacillus halophilus]|uniref:LapA family protein n=1 Tax=Halobacillus halophilus TaxID=1570 RepID=UPI001CD53624|nr:lipopolysaccharide assembly protein LapA domain-containing protein [Halobacillus halophilus]MCA1009790.1 lipopolysaccharide assembly protein LapA domain-containing protein [Halobacillus halophilus]
MKGQSYIIFAFVFALIIAIFAVINVDPVQVNYMFGTGEAPLILVILISVLLGGLATASVGAVRYFKLKRENRSLKQKVEQSHEPATSSDFDGTPDESVKPKEDSDNRNVT